MVTIYSGTWQVSWMGMETPPESCNEIDTKLWTFVNDIAVEIKTMSAKDFAAYGSFTAAVIIKLGLDSLSNRFASIVGQECVDEFYHDHEPKGFSAVFQLGLPLARLVPVCCSPSRDGRISVDIDYLFTSLRDMANAIRAGKVEYSICMRITNVDIVNDFDLGHGVHFRKLAPATVQSKYPIDHRFFEVSSLTEQNWLKHRVEVVMQGCGRMAELQKRFHPEESEALVNSILHTFLFADRPKDGHPFVTHVTLESPVEGHCLCRGIGQVTAAPPLLSADDIRSLQATYSFMVDAEDDRVLLTAIDRFILGKKQGVHHPNRVNEPHWDKLVDYVIAMEALFLTVEGNPVAQELAYRFRLNGTSLLRTCTNVDVASIFYALKHLYELRSKVVHGCDDSTMLKVANKFIAGLGIDRPQYDHSLGRLMIITKHVEQWLKDLLLHIGSMPIEERPYRKRDGWEHMLWYPNSDEL